MDPLAQMKAEIAAKKAKLAAAKASGGRKYLRKGDLEREAEKEEDDEPGAGRKRGRDDEAGGNMPADAPKARGDAAPPAAGGAGADGASSSGSAAKAAKLEGSFAVPRGGAVDDDSPEEEAEEEPPLPRAQVVAALRELGEPATLFGESAMRRYRRLMSLRAGEHERQTAGADASKLDTYGAMIRRLGSTGGGGGGRDGQGDGAGGGGDEGRSRELASGGGGSQRSKALEAAQQTALAEVAAVVANVQQAAGIAAFAPEMTAKSPEGSGIEGPDAFITRILTTLCGAWERKLRARPAAECRTGQGKRATATFVQTCMSLVPLLEQLRHGRAPSAVRDKVFEICYFLAEREYVKAHDSYIMLSIGNAAWPMGVTQVGIHERSGRTRISETNTAHILNDETCRKYIQSVKRLMTFAQEHRPADPSKMVRS